MLLTGNAKFKGKLCMNLYIFTHAPVFPRQEGMVKTMICFIEIQSEKYKDELEH